MLKYQGYTFRVATLTTVQRQALEDIITNPQDWHGVQSQRGRTVRKLLQLGLVEAAFETFEPASRTPYGRRLPGFTVWGQLSLTEAGRANPHLLAATGRITPLRLA